MVASQARPDVFHVDGSGWAETPGGRREIPAAHTSTGRKPRRPSDRHRRAPSRSAICAPRDSPRPCGGGGAILVCLQVPAHGQHDRSPSGCYFMGVRRSVGKLLRLGEDAGVSPGAVTLVHRPHLLAYRLGCVKTRVAGNGARPDSSTAESVGGGHARTRNRDIQARGRRTLPPPFTSVRLGFRRGEKSFALPPTDGAGHHQHGVKPRPRRRSS